MTSASRLHVPPARLAFALKAAAYAAVLVVSWHGLQGAFAVSMRTWDDLVERPFTADAPRLDAGGCDLGIYRPEVPHDLDRLLAAERELGHRFKVVSIYTAWGSGPEHRFPHRSATLVANAGYLPMVTWEPWTSTFDEDRYGPPADRAYRCLRDVAAGRYDDYVNAWARDCMAWGRPILLRLGHEMNNPAYPWSFSTGNTPGDFRAAWRHVWRLFEQNGCRNVGWVWTPIASSDFEVYYPGADCVDWVGVAVLNYGADWPPYRWQSFAQILGPSYARLARLGKPMLIPEIASVGDPEAKGLWLVEGLRALERDFPRVRLAVFFDAPNDTSHHREGVPWSFAEQPGILARLAHELARPWFRAPGNR